MARMPRQLSVTGYYHVVFRGVNHCHIFEEDEDFEKFLELLAAVKVYLDLKVCAYCLMDNHAHLLIQEKMPGDIIKAMRKVLSPYAYWFNRKYLRSGSLIANRYKSMCIESDEYLLALVRYIHQNPLVAGVVKRIESYRFSSYCDYTKNGSGLVDTDTVLEAFSLDPQKAIKAFVMFHEIETTEDYSLSDGVKRSEKDTRDGIISALGGTRPNEVCGLPKKERNVVLNSLRKQGFSIRQIERVTGISRKIIERA